MKRLLGILGLATLGASPVHAQNLVVNNNFSGNVLAPWVLTGPAIVANERLQLFSHFAFVDQSSPWVPAGPTIAKQTLNTVAGKSHILLFQMSMAPYSIAAAGQVGVYWGGDLLGHVMAGPTTQVFVFSPTATTTSTDLEFRFQLIGTCDHSLCDDAGSFAFLDNFAVIVTPEPSSYAMMAAGLAGLGLVARRRRWQWS